MTSQGIVITRNLVIKDNKTYVELIGKKTNSEKFYYLIEFKPYFFIKKKDAINIELKDTEFEKTTLKNLYNEDVVKLEFETYDKFKEYEEKLIEKNIELYESDVNQTQSFMNSYGLGSVLDFSETEVKDNIIINPEKIKDLSEINIGDLKKTLKILSIDIETNYKTNEILCVSIVIKENEKFSTITYITSQTNLENVEVCLNEKEMLEKLEEKIKLEKPDIITGWSVIDFDLDVIKKRCLHYKISFNIGYNGEELSITKQKNFFRDSVAKTKGIQILDGISLLKQTFLKVSDYKLNTVAKELLNDSKVEIESEKEKPEEIIELYNTNPQVLVEYNKKDSQLVIDILEKNSLLDIAIERSLVTGITLDRVKSAVATMESLYLTECRKKGYVMNNVAKNIKLEGISGGFVMESVPGLYDFILVLDFKSLYPSIIRTFNIDLLTGAQANDEYISAPNAARFSNKIEGILPGLIEKIWNLRDEAKKQKNETKSYALKVTMNSFFGVLANPNCRYFNYDVADAITNFGRFIIKKSIEFIQNKNLEVIYGDTDSLFILSKAKNKNDATNIGFKLENEINEFFNKFVQDEYKLKSILQIEFEKTYKKFFMPSIRGSESGAKKRYAGLLLKNNSEKIDITGLEYVRSDWTQLAKDFQMELLKKIFYEEPYKDFIKNTISKLNEGELDSKLVYRKKLTKPLEEYTKTTPPHVKAARMLDNITSSIIKYVMSNNGPIPIEIVDEQTQYDYEHYVEKQIKPIADSILPLLNTSFDDVIKGNKQSTLDFFN